MSPVTKAGMFVGAWIILFSSILFLWAIGDLVIMNGFSFSDLQESWSPNSESQYRRAVMLFIFFIATGIVSAMWISNFCKKKPPA